METLLPARALTFCLASILLLLCNTSLVFEVGAAEPSIADLVESFWSSTAENSASLSGQLKEASSDISVLYQALQKGPRYRSDVPTGQQESARVAADGTRFPYVFLVPESYDPAKMYPVEFMLHGGVSRPEWELSLIHI